MSQHVDIWRDGYLWGAFMGALLGWGIRSVVYARWEYRACLKRQRDHEALLAESKVRQLKLEQLMNEVGIEPLDVAQPERLDA